MAKQLSLLPSQGETLAGELSSLAERLGSTRPLCALAGQVFAEVRIETAAGLREFLEGFQARMLLPVELPAIDQAFHHASRYEVRELIALDSRLAQAPQHKDFANASQRVGRSYLKRLRPLRDQRLVQRYWRAVEAGEAHGWHTLVYGLALHVYSLPLRQGLYAYARQTLRGFIATARRSLPLPICDEEALLEGLLTPVPDCIDFVLNTREREGLRLPEPPGGAGP